MKGLNFLAAFLGGAAIGAALGILFAPEKGEDTRQKIKDILREKGIKAGLYRPITIRPLAVKPLRESVSRAKHILFTESANGQLAQMVLEKIYGLTTPYSTLFKMGVGVTGDDIVAKVESMCAAV